MTRLAVALKPPIAVEAAMLFARELQNAVLPALVCSVWLCDPAGQGAALATEVVSGVDALLAAILEFLASAGAQSLLGDGGRGGDGTDRGMVLQTGIVWSAADRIVALCSLGLLGVVERIVREQAGLVDDACSELREFINVQDDDDDDEEANDHGDNCEAEQLFWDGNNGKKKGLDAATKELAVGALKTVKLVGILLSAVRKRRLLGSGALRGQAAVPRVDAIASLVREISALVDDLATVFYEHDPDDPDGNDDGGTVVWFTSHAAASGGCGLTCLQARDALVDKAMALAQTCVLGSGDAEASRDGFSAWFESCVTALHRHKEKSTT